MKKTLAISIASATSLMLAACGAADTASESFNFSIHNAQGNPMGTLEIESIAGGGVQIDVDVKGLTPGTHAMHFHQFGLCEAPAYTSSGGHYNPTGVPHGRQDGLSHVGDMMNVEINENGTGSFKVKNMKVNIKAGSLPALMDADGTALVIHAGADDYKSQPSGAAGPRVACAVIPAG